MSGLTLGLFALACTFILRPDRATRVAQLLWAGVFCAAVVVFTSAPQTFAEVLVWAVAAFAIWLMYRGAARSELMYALVAGYLVGSAAPYLAHTLAPSFDATPLLVTSLVTWAAILAGLVLCGAAGGVMALISATLSQGQFAFPLVGAAVLFVGLAAMLMARARPRLSSGIPFFAPFVSLIEGVST